MIKEKNQLRKHAFEYRSQLQKKGMTDVYSSRIVNKIINSSDFINSSHIALYMPIKGEVDITPILNTKNKYFYIPKCNGVNLEFALFDKSNLMCGKFGIIESSAPAVNPDILDIIYVPCLMANKNGYRLGYGRGYYDRFFASKNIKAKKIIVSYNDLISNDFVADKFDYKCDLVISEV